MASRFDLTAEQRAALERNLRILPRWCVGRWIWLGEAIWVIFLVEGRGLTLGDTTREAITAPEGG